MFSLSLSKDQLRVEPGSAATLAVTIRNSGSAADRCELSISGLDVDWLAIPVPSFTLGPGEERSEKILIKPPRTAESKSGAYPFTVSVRSLESGQGTEQPAVLEIEPFNLISVEIEPKRGTAKYFQKQAPFSATVINLGNTEQNLQLFADDPEDGCTYQFAHERILLAPGQQRDVSVSVQPKHFPIIGGARLYGFAVSARGVENPLLAANAQAQVERRAMITPAFLFMTLLVATIAALWIAMRPKPASIDNFTAAPAEVTLGGNVVLAWNASNAKSVWIESRETNFKQTGLPPKGDYEITNIQQTTTFYAYAVNEMGDSEPLTVKVSVSIPPVVPVPVIETFSVSPKTCNVGDVVTVRYKVRDAVKIQLQPLGADLAVTGDDTHTFQATAAGKMVLKLIAYNAKNEATTETRTIEVADKSDARILVFRALLNGEPIKEGTELEPGTQVTIEWQVTNFARIDTEPRLAISTDQGTLELTVPEKSVEYRMTAMDSQGRPTVAKLGLKVKPLPKEPPVDIPPPN